VRGARVLTILAAAGLVAGCGGGSQSHGDSLPAAQAASGPLATSLVTPAGSWAIVPMAANPIFWQVFERPADGSTWRLVTPPGVADNGGLVAAGTGGSLTVAFRPSQGLLFSPLAISADSGAKWATGLLDADLADAPDALAGSGSDLLALLQDGTIMTSTNGGVSWSVLARPQAIERAAGTRCALTGITAVALSANATPLAAGTCTGTGQIGLFTFVAGSWQAAAPSLPADASAQRLQIVRMTSTPSGISLLVSATDGASHQLFAEWGSPAGAGWTFSAPLPADEPMASGTGTGGATWVLLPGGRAATISRGGGWQSLPAPPAGTVTLAPGAGGQLDALAAKGSDFTAWRLTGNGWDKVQTMNVPIQYGSSS
jgi:hypothetical protein